MSSSAPGPSTPSRSRSLNVSSLTVPVPTPAARNNPVALRIYKAIGTSFDDPGAREALEIVSSLYSGKAKGSAEDCHDHDEVKGDGGLDGMGVGRRAAKGESAALARKWLKKDIEARLVGGSQKFLEAFGEVDQKLSVLRAHMREMQVRCNQVQAELDHANSGTRYLLERADGLRSQRASAQARATIITLFLSQFTLSEAERDALTSREVMVGQALFDALDRVEEIRRDCRVLLGGEEEKMQAGLDIMALTSEQMERGYKKIHRWCQFEFRQFTREIHLEVSPVWREAMRRLRQRSAAFKDALQTLTSTRQASLLTSFLDALTRGGPNGLPRSIELHAHDPTRYVGDMLAWIHQTTASEHEFLEQLFGVKEKRRMVGSERFRNGGKVDEEVLVSDTLDKDLEGLGRPLKMRIQQTIKSQEGVIMAYKIANILQFYLVTMRKTIGEEALLSKTLHEIYEQANVAFFETLDAQGRSMLRFLHPPDNTLEPPLALRDSCQILRELIAVYDNSLVNPLDLPSNISDFSKLVAKAVDPAVEMCERVSQLAKGTTDREKDIFMINCLGYLVHILENQQGEVLRERAALLDKQIDEYVESMTFEHHGELLDQCGLGSIMKTIRSRPADTPLSRLPTTSSKNLTSALSTFSAFLSSLDVLSSPRLTLLSSRRLGEKIHRGALAKISAAYAEVCDRVLDKKEGYEFAETLLRRGKDEVAVALGVEERG